MLIRLLGGPRDGDEYEVSDDIWRQGILFVTVPMASVDFANPEIMETTTVIFKYVKQRFWQGWSCIALDRDSSWKIMHAAEPEFKWVYFDHNWTKI